MTQKRCASNSRPKSLRCTDTASLNRLKAQRKQPARHSEKRHQVAALRSERAPGITAAQA
jgi:hypothetical protein